MTEHRDTYQGAAPAPAARALALRLALAIAAGGAGPATAPAAQAQDSPRAACRSSATPRSSSCCATMRRRSCARPGLPSRTSASSCINDRTFNAFVMDGRHIFINAGALFDAKTPNEVIGVLAHETGHLAGGHLMRLREKLAAGADRSRSSRCCSASARWSPARAPARRRRRRGGDHRRRSRRSSARCSLMCARRKTRPTTPA